MTMTEMTVKTDVMAGTEMTEMIGQICHAAASAETSTLAVEEDTVITTGIITAAVNKTVAATMTAETAAINAVTVNVTAIK